MVRHFIYYVFTINLRINSINRNVVDKTWSVISYNSCRFQDTGLEKIGVQ